MIFYRAKFAVLRWLYQRDEYRSGDIPPEEVQFLIDRKLDHTSTYLIRLYLNHYASLKSYERAAETISATTERVVTRERVRQVVYKGVRQAWEYAKTSRI